jgi:hypothetical protein
MAPRPIMPVFLTRSLSIKLSFVRIALTGLDFFHLSRIFGAARQGGASPKNPSEYFGKRASHGRMDQPNSDVGPP